MPHAATVLKAWPDRVALCRCRATTPGCLLDAAILLAATIGWRTPAAHATTAELLDQVVAATGDEYRKAVSVLLHQPDMKQVLDAVAADAPSPWKNRLVARIVSARAAHANVFQEYDEHVKSIRDRINSPSKPLGTRPGFLSGQFSCFTDRGPESKIVEIHVGTMQIDGIEGPKFEKVEKYTDAEVAAGKVRNAAARLALVEHALKFYREGGEYEQRELVYAIREMVRGLPGRIDATVPVDSIIQEVYHDTTRPLSVRATALMYLPEAERKTVEHNLMLTILKSDETSDEQEHESVVDDAIRYLKKNAPELLKEIKAKPRWKQALINKALGLPAPPPSEEDLRRERKELDTE